MDKYFSAFAFPLVLCYIIGLIGAYDKKKETGEFDWKDFGKFALYGMVLSIAAVLGVLVHG